MIIKYLNLTKTKFPKIGLVGLGFFCLLPITTLAQDRGLSLTDLGIIKVKVELAKMWVGQFKPYFDSHIGTIDTSFLSDTFIRDKYVSVAFAFLALLFVIEIVACLIEKSNFKTLLPRLVTSLVASTAYVAIITMVLTLANGFMAGLMGNGGSFIEFTQKSMDVLNVEQGLGSTIQNTIFAIIIPGSSAFNVAGNQTKFVLDILLGAYTIIPFVIGISQFVTDLIINVMFIISPLVAITHIHGSKIPIARNFWNIFFDLIVSKVAFTISYTFLTGIINNKIATAAGTIDVGLACFIIGCFIGMGAITMTIREVFNMVSSYAIREQINKTSGTPSRVIQSTTNVVSGGIQTIQSLRRGV